GREPVLELREYLAHERTDRAAGGENEVQNHRASVVHLLGERDGLAVIPYQPHGGHGVAHRGCARRGDDREGRAAWGGRQQSKIHARPCQLGQESCTHGDTIGGQGGPGTPYDAHPWNSGYHSVFLGCFPTPIIKFGHYGTIQGVSATSAGPWGAAKCTR